MKLGWKASGNGGIYQSGVCLWKMEEGLLFNMFTVENMTVCIDTAILVDGKTFEFLRGEYNCFALGLKALDREGALERLQRIVEEFGDELTWSTEAAATAVPSLPSTHSPPLKVPVFFQVLDGKDSLKPDMAAAFMISPSTEAVIRKMLRKVVASGTSPVRQYHATVLESETEEEIVPTSNQTQDPLIMYFKQDVGLEEGVWNALSFVRVELKDPSRRLIVGLTKTFAAGEVCDCCGTSSVSLKRCGMCKHMFYCSKECQKIHWKKIHKKTCEGLPHVDFRVVEDPEERARQIHASREAGELVLDMESEEGILRTLEQLMSRRP